jgi:hypothetical protein
VELAAHDGTGAETLDVRAVQLRLTHADEEWRLRLRTSPLRRGSLD